MELADLNHEERVALLGLMEMAVVADGEATTDEAAHVKHVVDAFGEESYRACLAEVEERLQTEEAVKACARTVTRQEAREIIYGNLLETVDSDLMVDGEADLLEWLAGEWGIEVTSVE